MTDEAWIDTVRLARDMGTVSQLLPDWVSDVMDAPYVLFDAIRTALIFLSFEELPQEEQPPRRIWLDGERLRDWFRQVKRKREDRMRSESGNSSYETSEMEENDAARQLLVG